MAKKQRAASDVEQGKVREERYGKALDHRTYAMQNGFYSE
jgi:hypothetical protein